MDFLTDKIDINNFLALPNSKTLNQILHLYYYSITKRFLKKRVGLLFLSQSSVACYVISLKD